MKQDLINASTELLEKQKQEDIWKDQTYEAFSHLSADFSGKAGEVALYRFLIRTKELGLHNYEVFYDGDSNVNAKDGTYDMGIKVISKKKRAGIKTARIGKQKSYQHDHLHDGGCDVEFLIDITPSSAHLTVIDFKNYSLKEKHPIFGLTPHLRKNTNNNYKLDLRENHIQKGIQSGITINIGESTDLQLVEFLSKFLD